MVVSVGERNSRWACGYYSRALTVVEVHAERVLRQDLAAHLELAEPEPGYDDGDGHDDDEPERHGAHDSVPEGLADLLVVVCEGVCFDSVTQPLVVILISCAFGPDVISMYN